MKTIKKIRYHTIINRNLLRIHEIYSHFPWNWHQRTFVRSLLIDEQEPELQFFNVVIFFNNVIYDLYLIEYKRNRHALCGSKIDRSSFLT